MRPLSRVLITASLTALLAAGVGATADAKHVKPDLRHVPKLKAIPPALRAAFPVLAQPVPAKIPDLVLRSFQDPLMVKTYGVDPRQARAINGLRGGTWYVIPGTKGLCLFVSAGFSCARTAQAVAGKLGYFRVPPGSAGQFSGDGPETVLGLAPAGVTGVTTLLRTGATQTDPLGPSGAYRLELPGPFTTVTLTGGPAPLVTFGPSAPPPPPGPPAPAPAGS